MADERGALMWVARESDTRFLPQTHPFYVVSVEKPSRVHDTHGVYWEAKQDTHVCMRQMHQILERGARLRPGGGPIRVFIPEARRAKEDE